MPVKKCQRDNEDGFKWGDTGYCYLPSEEGGEDAAREKASEQGVAIEASQEASPDVADLSKYIEVRQHPPGKFSSYQHKYLNRTLGIIKSIGQWKKTGAEIVQKLLFERAKGWTEETVKAWFGEHPEYHYPEPIVGGIFFAMADEDMNNIVSDAFVAESLPIGNFSEAEKVNAIAIRGGWGKNKRRGPDGNIYQDFFPDGFLQSLVPLLDGAGVQAVKVRPPGEVSDGEIPDAIKGLVAELQQYGHPPDTVNMLLSQGLSGNTIGIFKSARVEYPDGTAVMGEVMTEPYVMTEVVLADNEHAMQARSLFETAWKHGLRKSLGLSINYKANVLFTEHDGRPACMFLQCTKFVSCEFVVNPGAGGLVLGSTSTQGEHNMKDKKQDVLQAGQETQSEAEVKPPEGTQEIQTSQQEASPNNTEAATGKAAIVATQEMPSVITEELVMEQVKKVMQPIISELKSSLVGSFRQEAAEVVSSAFKQATDAQKLKNSLVASVTQAENISPEAKDAIRGKIEAGDVNDADGVKFLLELAAQQQQTPVFPGMNGGKAQVGAERKDFNKIRSKLMWDIPLTQEEQDMQKKYGITRFLGIQQEYREYTGDINLKLKYDPNYFAQQVHPEMLQHRGLELADGSFSQAVVTTTYADLLTHVLDQSLKNHYEVLRKDHLKLAYEGEPYFDNRDHEEFLVGSFPEIATVAENADYQEIKYGHVEKLTSSSEKRGVPIARWSMRSSKRRLATGRHSIMLMSAIVFHRVERISVCMTPHSGITT
jgi:rhodanese-related sulfurtransferase